MESKVLLKSRYRTHFLVGVIKLYLFPEITCGMELSERVRPTFLSIPLVILAFRGVGKVDT